MQNLFSFSCRWRHNQPRSDIEGGGAPHISKPRKHPADIVEGWRRWSQDPQPP
ncbi:hypothetical protein [Thiothrix fructosivorans]|uniref:Uncharacterized protein n=1 Tax=Thiothrix fructosivorans TaxID=111770 RepID=A0A8B0SQ00_9GAMM|nr:hypothetical protein [Thiothrix fructosivorans]MBO0611347.1 hypothetical protein [Thiothrix fructosivorans]QTX13111.1 hypothetical protein J1836_020925 [Thiothrix fructosivorans]